MTECRGRISAGPGAVALILGLFAVSLALGCSEQTAAAGPGDAAAGPGDAQPLLDTKVGEIADAPEEILDAAGDIAGPEEATAANADTSADGLSDANADTAGDLGPEVIADAISDAASDIAADALSDAELDGAAPSDLNGDADIAAGPAWLGVCPPDPVTALGDPGPALGFPVPGVACAKPGWPSPAKWLPPVWTDVTAGIGLGQIGLVDSCALWQDFSGDGRPDLVIIEQPLSPTAKRILRYYEWNPNGPWFVSNTFLPASQLVTDCNPIDYDDDGDVDIALSTGNGLRMILNMAGQFYDAAPGVVPAPAKSALVFSSATLDLDRDGDQDLYLARTGPMNLQPGQYSCQKADPPYIQCCYGGGALDQACAVAKQATPIDTYQCCTQFLPGATNVLLRNDSKMMTDISIGSGCDDAYPTLTTATHDINRDGWPDLFAGNDFGPLGWYRGQGNGTCKYSGAAAGLRPYGHMMGVGTADFDRDGWIDLAHGDVGPVSIYKGQPGGGWQNAGNQFGTWNKTKNSVGWAQLPADFDNDGWVDLWSLTSLSAQADKLQQAMESVNPQPLLAPGYHVFFHNQGATFNTSLQPWPTSKEQFISPLVAAAADMEGDGDLDMVYTTPPGYLKVMRNDTPLGSHWISMELVRDVSALGGIGAKVQVWAQGYVQEREISWSPGTGTHGSFTGHIGLGAVDKIDEVVVWWPSGRVSMLGPQAVDQVLVVLESSAQIKQGGGSGGSDAGGTGGDADAVAVGPSGIEPLDLQAQLSAPFVDITESMGLGQAPGLKRRACAAGLDLDGDGRDDLALVESQPGPTGKQAYQIRAMLNKPSGWVTKFSKIDATMVVPAMGCNPLDVSGDGVPDLVIGTVGSGMAVFVGDGQGGFVDKSSDWLPEFMEFDAWAVAMGDLDQDGVPELLVGAGNESGMCGGINCAYLPGDFVCKYPSPVPAIIGNLDRVFARKAAGQAFAEVPGNWNLPPGGEVTIPLLADLDRDGWQDLLISNDFGDHYLLHNQQGKLVRHDADIGFVPYAHGMGWGVGDFNLDGLDDLILADAGPLLVYQGQKPAAGLPVAFAQSAKAWGVDKATHDTVVWDPLVFDFDHDGYEDVWLGLAGLSPKGGIVALGSCQSGFATPPQRDVLLHNSGAGSFAPLLGPLPADQDLAFASTVSSTLDLDDDGDLDIVQVRRGGYAHVYRNDWPKANSSVLVRLSAPGPNAAQLGAWMTASIGGKTHLRRILGTTGFGGASSWRGHFGLGQATQIDELTVHWPSGKVSKHGPFAGGAKVTLKAP